MSSDIPWLMKELMHGNVIEVRTAPDGRRKAVRMRARGHTHVVLHDGLGTDAVRLLEESLAQVGRQSREGGS